MKANFKSKKGIAMVACIAAVILTGVTAYASGGFEYLQKVIKEVKIGDHSTYTQVENIVTEIDVPENLKGQLFDKNGNVLTKIKSDEMLYNKNGEVVFLTGNDNSEIKLVTEAEYNANIKAQEENYTKIYDLNEATKYFNEDVMLPSYLPEGYKFDRVQFYSDIISQNEKSDYMIIVYSNGSTEFEMNLRHMTEETAYFASTDQELEELVINGNKAVKLGRGLTVGIGNVEYTLSTNDVVSMDELVKMAESLK